MDVVSFTGSAETAAVIRSHPRVLGQSVRVNVEADSLNSALLMPDATPGSEAFELFVREVAREITVKSGQKCTAIRRAFVPEALYDAAAEALVARLSAVIVGNPRHPQVQMGALVSREQWHSVQAGLTALSAQADVLLDGRLSPLLEADPAVAACLGPTLLGCRTPQTAQAVHRLEVFGPCATLMPYADLDQAGALIRRGEGSLVASLYGGDATTLAQQALDLADSHGRVHVVTPEVARLHSGHGNVMPQSLHGGPGRAGGGEELGGLRALAFYQRRTAVQASPAVLAALGPSASLG
jgi:3,4-dehydroadipyl-CoA semialdehyde dehydrogenase